MQRSQRGLQGTATSGIIRLLAEDGTESGTDPTALSGINSHFSHRRGNGQLYTGTLLRRTSLKQHVNGGAPNPQPRSATRLPATACATR